MYTCNDSRIRGFLCWVVPVAFALTFAAGCGGGRSDQYRQEADSYLSLGKTREAQDLYQKALDGDPNNALAQVGLGRCLAAQGKPEEALARYREVIRNSPATPEAYWQAVDVLLALGRQDEAVTIAKQYEPVDEEQAGLLQTRVLLATGKPSDAVSLLASLLEKKPDSAALRMELGQAYLVSGESGKAEEIFREVAGKPSPYSTAAWVGLVGAMSAQGKAAAAVEQLETLAAQSPNDDGVKAALACGRAEAGRIAEGESLARELVQGNPASGWANYALGVCLLKKRAPGEAVEFLQKAAGAMPRDFFVQRNLKLARGRGADVSTSETAQAPAPKQSPAGQEGVDWPSLWKQAALQRLLDDREQFLATGGENLRETLVAAAVFRGDRQLAVDLAKGLPQESPLHGYLQALNEGKAEDLLKALEPWTKRKDQLGLIGHNLLGHAMSLFGVRARAIQVFSGCRTTWPDYAVSLFNGAQVFRMAGMPKYAAQTLEQVIAQYPNNPEPYLFHFIALRESGDTDDARRSAQAAFAIFPDVPEVAINLSQAYLDDRQPSDAENLLTKSLDASPDDSSLRVALAIVLLREGKAQECLDLLEGRQLSPDKVAQGAVLQALALAELGNWQRAAEVAKSGEGTPPQALARMIEAAAQLKSGLPDEAAVALTRPDDAVPYGGRVGAMILRALGKPVPEFTDPEEAALADTLSKAPELLGDFAFAGACQMGDLHDEAFAALERVETKISEGSLRLLPLMYASIARSVQIPDPAAKAREVALRHASSPVAWLGLATVLRGLGDTKGQEEALDKAAEAGPQEPVVFLQRGMFFEAQKDSESAIKEYRHMLELRPEDPVGNNNLAYSLLSTGGDPAEAREHALVAFKALPQDPHILHTLGVAELRTGDLDESLKHLEGALQRMPGEPTLLLDYGLLLVAQGKPQEGWLQAQAAVSFTDQFGLDFPRRAEAEEILKTIPAPSPPPSPAPVTAPVEKGSTT